MIYLLAGEYIMPDLGTSSPISPIFQVTHNSKLQRPIMSGAMAAPANSLQSRLNGCLGPCAPAHNAMLLSGRPATPGLAEGRHAGMAGGGGLQQPQRQGRAGGFAEP